MILNGIKGILASKKAVMCLIILAVSATLTFLGKMDPSFAAIVATIGTIYCYTVARTEINAMSQPPTLPPGVQL